MGTRHDSLSGVSKTKTKTALSNKDGKETEDAGKSSKDTKKKYNEVISELNNQIESSISRLQVNIDQIDKEGQALRLEREEYLRSQRSDGGGLHEPLSPETMVKNKLVGRQSPQVLDILSKAQNERNETTESQKQKVSFV